MSLEGLRLGLLSERDEESVWRGCSYLVWIVPSDVIDIVVLYGPVAEYNPRPV
jgi:hypothetical protein